jgi:hypothetical protein
MNGSVNDFLKTKEGFKYFLTFVPNNKRSAIDTLVFLYALMPLQKQLWRCIEDFKNNI